MSSVGLHDYQCYCSHMTTTKSDKSTSLSSSATDPYKCQHSTNLDLGEKFLAIVLELSTVVQIPFLQNGYKICREI